MAMVPLPGVRHDSGSHILRHQRLSLDGPGGLMIRAPASKSDARATLEGGIFLSHDVSPIVRGRYPAW